MVSRGIHGSACRILTEPGPRWYSGTIIGLHTAFLVKLALLTVICTRGHWSNGGLSYLSRGHEEAEHARATNDSAPS